MYIPTDQIIYESSVNHALRHWLRPGDTVVDAGAHWGHLTRLMSRLVGPRGQVLAIEANPHAARRLTAEMNTFGTSNTHLLHAAVWHTSDLQMRFRTYTEGEGQNSHLEAAPLSHIPPNAEVVSVHSIKLDDYFIANNLTPRLIKLDVECAEIEAITGLKQTIGSHRPILIVEESAQRNVESLLRPFGYLPFNLSSWKAVDVRKTIQNVLYIHPDDERFHLSQFEPQAVIEWDTAQPNGPFGTSTPLPAGFYVVELITEGIDSQEACELVIRSETTVHTSLYASVHHLLHNYTHLPIRLHQPGPLHIALRGTTGSLGRSYLKGAILHRVPGMNRARFPNEL